MNAFEANAEPAYVPGLGDWTTDARTGRVGSVVSWDGSTLTLRASDGEEWDTAEFRRPTTRELLVPRVAETNRRTRRGL
ncbi:hypothetical protein [Streptomyces adelaidensis]|uniref:hypothetical protein n=1 Tax=Streptomyces adelaidensis TaxID=2796465 RepID=UPI00190785D2|nr:hypothetical protein [Streptomyces adelaidensis]